MTPEFCERMRLVTNTKTRTGPQVSEVEIEPKIFKILLTKPTKPIGHFTTPDTRTGPQASSTIIDHRRTYVEQLLEVMSGENIHTLGANDSDNTATSIPSLVGPTLP